MLAGAGALAGAAQDANRPLAIAEAADELSVLSRAASSAVGTGIDVQGSMSFDARMRAQRAIEDVYRRRRARPVAEGFSSPVFEAEPSDEAIRATVEEYLEKSLALGNYWARPITGDQLRAEADRLAQSNRHADLFREISEALGNDPAVIEECLARPMLADRLVRQAYAQDARFQAEARGQAESALARVGAVEEMKRLGGIYTETRWKRVPEEVAAILGTGGLLGTSVALGPEGWNTMLRGLEVRFGLRNELDAVAGGSAAARGEAAPESRSDAAASLPLRGIGPLQEDGTGFFVLGILDRTSDSLNLATVRWRKIPFDSWWRAGRAGVAVEDTIPAASAQVLAEAPLGGRTPPRQTASADTPGTALATTSSAAVAMVPDVHGPDAAIDGAIARFDGTSGKLLKNYDLNAPTISDSGDIVVRGNLSQSAGREVSWPTSYQRCTDFPICNPSGTIDSKFIWGLNTPSFAGQTDNVSVWGYNYSVDGGKYNPNDASLKLQIEATYWDSLSRVQFQEFNMDYYPIDGPQWRPLYTQIATGGPGAGDKLNTMFWEWRTAAQQPTFRINNAGDGGIEVGEFSAQRAHMALITHRISTADTAQSSQDAIKSVLELNLDGASAAAYEYVGNEGTSTAANFSADNTVSALIGSRGLGSLNGDSSGIRSVAGYTAGLEGRCWITPTGSTLANSGPCLGGRFQASAHGSATNVDVPVLAGVFVASPAPKGAGMRVASGAGVWIQDMKGYGTSNQGSLLIDAQTGGVGTGAKGNLLLRGGAFDNGHIALNAGHLWYDGLSARFRVKLGAPTSDADGDAVVTGTRSNSYGPMLWAASGTTCTSACTAEALTCVNAWAINQASSAVGCASLPADKTCMCK